MNALGVESAIGDWESMREMKPHQRSVLTVMEQDKYLPALPIELWIAGSVKGLESTGAFSVAVLAGCRTRTPLLAIHPGRIAQDAPERKRRLLMREPIKFELYGVFLIALILVILSLCIAAGQVGPTK